MLSMSMDRLQSSLQACSRNVPAYRAFGSCRQNTRPWTYTTSCSRSSNCSQDHSAIESSQAPSITLASRHDTDTAPSSLSPPSLPIVKEATEQYTGNGARPQNRWPHKADLSIVRTDGMSCTRETVRASGVLTFSHPSSNQHLLVWARPPQCVLVVKKLGEDLTLQLASVLQYLHNEEKMKVIVEPSEYDKLVPLPGLEFVDTYSEEEAERLHQYIDFVICLGGDGVLLHASSLFKRAIPPVVSFNLGSMGFLTNHDFASYKQDLRNVIYGCESLEQCALDSDMKGVHITLRMRLFCEICRRGEPVPDQTYEVLNEVVVDRGANPFLTKIECWERDRLITKVQADGVMLATPTGSTAYSVAAGGSMVHPNVAAILFTPICPHSLSFRPVILPDCAELDLRIPEDARCSAWVCFDGKQRQELQKGDSVRVRMSPYPVPTINKTDQTNDWFHSLERCFGWNERAEQKELNSNKFRAMK